MRGAAGRVLAGVALLAGLPVFAALTLIARGAGRPAFFRQERLGRGGHTFTLLKLRTMRAGPGPAVTAGDDPRITPVGRFLRRHRLDEWPQLWNVLRGDMALVGPRPEHPRFRADVERLAPEILSVRPGLTDPATLAHLDEEAELADREDPEAYYRDVILPAKLEIARRALTEDSLARDVRVVTATALALLGGGRR